MAIGKMTYIPFELQADVQLLLMMHKAGNSYEIRCYDSKEETEKKEEKFPHTPLKEVRKEKEEKHSSSGSSIKKTKKSSFFREENPSLDKIVEYHKEQGFTTYKPVAFYNYYNTYGWKSKGGGLLRNSGKLGRFSYPLKM